MSRGSIKIDRYDRGGGGGSKSIVSVMQIAQCPYSLLPPFGVHNRLETFEHVVSLSQGFYFCFNCFGFTDKCDYV